MQVRYQAALRPDWSKKKTPILVDLSQRRRMLLYYKVPWDIFCTTFCSAFILLRADPEWERISYILIQKFGYR